MDGRCQLVGGVDGGTVLQDELEAGSAPAAAGIEERCGAICWHCHCLENDVCEKMHPKEHSVPHLFIYACDTNIHKHSNRANTRDNQQLKDSLHADFSSDLFLGKSKLFRKNTSCGLKRVKVKICVKAGKSVSSQMSLALFELRNFRHPEVKFTGKWVRCSNQATEMWLRRRFFQL